MTFPTLSTPMKQSTHRNWVYVISPILDDLLEYIVNVQTNMTGAPKRSRTSPRLLLPTSVSLLDVYAAPTYISPEPIPFYAAPVRTLSTAQILDEIKLSPPNLITSTSASFYPTLPSKRKPQLCFSFPLPNTTSLTKETVPSNLPSAMEDYASWPEDTMSSVHQWLFFSMVRKSKIIPG
ncbi:hypothetical protein BDZ89DRAFT_1125616 [Hymenopellis radicata]|nr:hypothetical protein BDZ89DRAFT_1125616 [Hymenopellis radicata]